MSGSQMCPTGYQKSQGSKVTQITQQAHQKAVVGIPTSVRRTSHGFLTVCKVLNRTSDIPAAGAAPAFAASDAAGGTSSGSVGGGPSGVGGAVHTAVDSSLGLPMPLGTAPAFLEPLAERPVPPLSGADAPVTSARQFRGAAFAAPVEETAAAAAEYGNADASS